MTENNLSPPQRGCKLATLGVKNSLVKCVTSGPSKGPEHTPPDWFITFLLTYDHAARRLNNTCYTT